MNDAELMQAYASKGSQEAFETLVNQYTGLVYAACRRQLRDSHEAEDATQAVFLLLSQNARSIRQDRAAGWLLTTARYACANIRRSNQRRQRREQVVAMDETRSLESVKETNMAEMLDAGLGRLGETDREALVLRYLRQQSFEEVGRALGISTEAARKRVDRGVDKLRHYYERRGITTQSAAVSALLVKQLGNTGLTPEGLKQMMQGVLHTARTGGQSTAASVKIAKGTKTMMMISKVKTASTAGALVLALAASGWGLTTVLTGGGVKTRVAAATATESQGGKVNSSDRNLAVPSQTDVVIDCTTPENALASFCRAVQAGDRDKAYACLTTDPKRTPTTMDAFLTWNFAQNRLLQAAHKKFGDDAEELRRGQTFDGIARIWKDNPAGKAVINGDTASWSQELPESIMAVLPQEVQTIVRPWSGKPMRFHKVKDQWKLDLDASMHVISTLNGDNPNSMAEQEKRSVAVITDYAKLMDEVAQGIEQGTWKTLNTSVSMLESKRAELSDKYKFKSMEIVVVPADPPMTP